MNNTNKLKREGGERVKRSRRPGCSTKPHVELGLTLIKPNSKKVKANLK